MFYKSIGFRYLIAVGLIVTFFSGFVVYCNWSQNNSQIEKLLTSQVDLALHFDLAIREYIAESVRPFAEQHVAKGEFVPETMSTSFVARSIFEKVHKKFPDYILKFSSDNPRNPINLAGPKELEMIEYFNSNPEVENWNGIIDLNGKKHMARFNARRMKDCCLRCHGVPQDAPRALLEKYGDKAGFYHPVGEVVALDTVAIPVEKYLSAASRETAKNSLVLAVGMIFLLVLTYYSFHFLVGRKLSRISKHFKDVKKDETDLAIRPIDYQGNDEIGQMVQSFNKMVKDLGSTTTSIDNLNAANQKLKASQLQLQSEVTERKQTEGALAFERAQLLSIFDSIDESIYVIDPVTCEILYVNQAMQDIFHKELIGDLCYREIQGLDSPCEFCTNEIIMKQKPAPYQWEYYNPTVDKDFALVDRIIKWPDGRDVRFEFAVDITERKRAEEAIKHKLMIEKTLTNISGRFVGIFDLDEAVNASLNDMGRLNRADRIYVFRLRDGGDILDNTHEWCAEGVASEIDNLQNFPSSMFPWWMAKLREGEMIHIADVSAMPKEAIAEKETLESQGIKSLLVLPLNVGGKLDGFIGFDNVSRTGLWKTDDLLFLGMVGQIFGNAIERKQVESALQVKTYDLGERIKELNCLYNLSKLIDEHDSLEAIFSDFVEVIPSGWQYPEITCAKIIALGSEFKSSDFVHTEWKQNSEIFVAGKPSGIIEVFYKQQRPEEDEGPFLKDERNLINTLAERLGNLIERKLAIEKAYMHQSETAHVSRVNSIGEMASSLAHEINHPLFVMQAQAERSSKLLEFGSQNIDTVIDKMQIIIKQADRAQKIISRIRGFVRKGKSEKQKVSLNVLINNSIDLLQADIKHKKIKLQLDMSTDDLKVNADPVQIEQVIVNLINNSIDALTGVPKNERQISIKSFVAEGSAEVRITDNGSGMTPKEMQNVFDSFYTTKTDGLGIGLSISRSIIESQGGRIGLEPNSDKGVTSYFTLPANKAN